MRFRAWAYLAICLGLVPALLIKPVWGQADAPPAAPVPAGRVTVKIDTTAGTELQGTIPELLSITTDFGTVELNLNKVKTIDISPQDNHIVAIIQLLDKTHLDGKVVNPELILRSQETNQTLNIKDIREISIQRPKLRLSLLAFIAGLITLAVMEIVLGIDNVIFLAIVSGRLPKEQQPRARRIGMAAALGTRLLLLFSLSWLLGLTKPVFTLPIPALSPDARDISWRDMIMLSGGLFLIVKSVMEMHHKLEESKDQHSEAPKPKKTVSFAKIIVQIAIIDIVFSLDSVITAVGMVDDVTVMVSAMIIAMAVMLMFAGPIANFVEKYPTIKVLALSFLILIGVLLVAEGMGQHVDKGYVYFAMAFGVGVELVNILMAPKGVPQMVAGEKPTAKELA
jgi:predicted tellurium resistance membrane protein TerC